MLFVDTPMGGHIAAGLRGRLNGQADSAPIILGTQVLGSEKTDAGASVGMPRIDGPLE